MPRPARFGEDAILDAALDELARRGPRGVSMAGIARSLGAPSGSLYHRFPSRDRLMAALWLRTVERFQASFVERLGAADDVDAGLDHAVRFVVAWARERPAEASLLTRFRREDLIDGPWPDNVAERASTLATQLEDAATQLARRIWPDGDADMPALW
ncbi:MAG: helix-turn-helix domain-containing protein, partial [Myxococcota bacterium]